MNAIRRICGLLFGAALMAGCTERNTQGPLATTGAGLSADATGATTSAVVDAVGDAVDAPAWLDLASASITRKRSRFYFTVDVAGSIPADPSLDPATPTQVDHVCPALDGLDTDRASAPAGYPFGKNEANWAEFYLGLCWNPSGSFGLGTGFVGLFIDRRPLLSGGQARVLPIEVSIQRTRVSFVVDAAALGDPESFAWVAFSEVAKHADPNDVASFPDAAPDVNLGAPFAIWPQ